MCLCPKFYLSTPHGWLFILFKTVMGYMSVYAMRELRKGAREVAMGGTGNMVEDQRNHFLCHHFIASSQKSLQIRKSKSLIKSF